MFYKDNIQVFYLSFHQLMSREIKISYDANYANYILKSFILKNK